MPQLQNMLRVGSSLLTQDDAFLSICLVIESPSEFLASTWSIGPGSKVIVNNFLENYVMILLDTFWVA